jgi:methylphosphotriester-DNA--protein-cysteine methyltransferase
MAFSTDEERFRALINRDPEAEGKFFYCVLSTKIFCRPTCYSRLALRQNIIFSDSQEEAMKNGFRPCKRCKPTVKDGWNTTREFVIKGCALIYTKSLTGDKFYVSDIFKTLGVSKWHFCRAFKNYTGKTPRQFYLQCQKIKINPTILKPIPIIETKKSLNRKRNSSHGEFVDINDDTSDLYYVTAAEEEIDNINPVDSEVLSPYNVNSDAILPENEFKQLDELFSGFDSNYDEFFFYLNQENSFHEYLANMI